MSEVSPASTSPATARSLVIAESAEAAQRYASSDSNEVELAVAASDGTVEAAGGPFDVVVVVGFASSPETLRVAVDRAFVLVGGNGRVLIGAGDGEVETDTTRWDSAFEGIQVKTVDKGSFPSVEVVRHEGASAGTFIAGAISALSATSPRPVLTVTPATPVDVPAPAKAATKSRSAKDRLVRIARRHRKILVLAALATLIVLVISVGLVALFGRYYLAVLLTLILLMVLALGARQEQRLRQLARRVESTQTGVNALVTGLRPAALFKEVRQQSRDLEQIQKVVGVNQLTIVEISRTLEDIREGSDDSE